MQTVPWQKIESLQNEIDQLKSLGIKEVAKKAKGGNSLKGMLKDVLKGPKVTEEDFKEAEIKFDIEHILYQKHTKKVPEDIRKS